MAGIDVGELEPGEESTNNGDHFVGHVFGLGTADEQRRLLEPRLVRVLEGEIPHLVEVLADDAERDPELLRLAALGPVQVAEEKLPDREFLSGRGYTST